MVNASSKPVLEGKAKRTSENKSTNRPKIRGGNDIILDPLCAAVPVCHTLDLSAPSAVMQAPAASTPRPPVAGAPRDTAAVGRPVAASGSGDDARIGAKSLKRASDRVVTKNVRRPSSLAPGSGTGASNHFVLGNGNIPSIPRKHQTYVQVRRSFWVSLTFKTWIQTGLTRATTSADSQSIPSPPLTGSRLFLSPGAVSWKAHQVRQKINIWIKSSTNTARSHLL